MNLGPQQEPEEVKAVAEGPRIAETIARDDQSLGYRGVAVGQPVLRPGPARDRRRLADRSPRIGEQRSGRRLLRPLAEQFRRAQRRERHRPEMRRAALRRYPEPDERPGAHARCPGSRRSDTQAPQRPAPPVTHRSLITPLAADGHAVVTGAARLDRIQDDTEVAAGQAADGRHRLRLRAHHDKTAGRVVEAVTVLGPRDRMQGVLKEAAAVGEALEVAEFRLRNAPVGDHPAGAHAATLAVISRPASLRYWSATAGHRRRGAAAAAAAAIVSIMSPRVIMDRSAAAMAGGSRCGTTRPAPPASSSLACGNRVATTGLPAATASMSTPEVT